MPRGFSPLPRHTGESRGAGAVRMLLLICVFAGVAWLYTRHFDRTLADIQSRAAIHDASGLLDSGQMRQLRDFAALFRDEFGVELVLRISQGPVEIPRLKSKTLFLGLDLDNRTLMVEYPTWMRRALGPGFTADLETAHMAPYFASDSWPTGLLMALKRIWDQLMAQETRETPAQ
ncbi:hypothetical protein [Desulfocurvus sp.]|jgi:hypothetical protein|uniref:hypothetical protein n=1 Tax=Desulfocurvus sp. TaxID=2871698 RepID=UPI0025C647E6|nr:hypothetical protein [Desulfocurvus sp.]MCK9238978.1 hypothetical protein [Desulfocurvus sp.]